MEIIMHVRFRHTGITSRDWKGLAAFYEEVFGCVRVPPERHLSGAWLEKGTGVRGASFSGTHLHLPGFGDGGPTLEIFQYTRTEPKPAPRADREGYTHIAFEVDDVQSALDRVLAHGGSTVGAVSTSEVPGMGLLTFVYAADPEGNIIELQSWNHASSDRKE